MKPLLAAALLAAMLTANGQTLNPRPAALSRVVDMDPALVPATATDVTTTTIWVIMITLSNESGSDITCTVTDRQSTPRALVGPGITVRAGEHWIQWYPEGRKMTGGIRWSCSNGSSVTGYIVGRQP
jgi:hypothetical protein